nr:unconventional prefoldin RPB5 interactor [Crassostrea gigas]
MDLKHIQRLEEEQNFALIETNRKLEQWETFRSDYEALRERMTTLPDKTTHDIMVPFGSLAFMPGKLVHTNEILVLLGDNWFVERSAKQATEIIGRRIKTVEQQIKELQAQKHLLEPRLEFTKNLPGGSRNEDYFEIAEEFDPEKEKLWREEHRKSVQRQRKKEKLERKAEERNKTLTDEEIWKRLDDLERQEAEGRELQRIQELEAPDDLELVERSQGNTLLSPIEKPPRKVHFNDDQTDSSFMEESDDDSEVEDSDDFTSGSCEENEEDRRESKTQVINFKHSQAEERLQPQEMADSEEASSDVKSPRDVYRLYKPGTKSILKNSNSARKVKVKKKSDTQRPSLQSPLSSVQAAFSGVVVEKKVLDPLPSLSTEQKSPEKRQESTPEEIQKPARVSKFKAQRQNLSKS